MPTYGYQDPVVLISWQCCPASWHLLNSVVVVLCGFTCAGTAQSVSDLRKAAVPVHIRLSVTNHRKKHFQLKTRKKESMKERIVCFQHKHYPSVESLRSKGRHFIKSVLKPKKLRAAVNILQCLAEESLSDERSKPLPCINL